jgi:predicted HTH transcriptional regulator
MKLNVHPIYKLIAQGEHQTQDFKFCISDSRKIARSLVAFANSDGGRLLVGVKDNGKIIGVRSEEEYYMVEAAAKIYSKPKIDFSAQQWDVDGKTVFEVMIEPSPFKPHYAQSDEGRWIAYIRKDDENILANGVLLKSWKLEKEGQGIRFSYDHPRETLINYLTQNESITLSKFSKIALISRLHAVNILAELLNLKCIEARFGENPVTYFLNSDFDIRESR